ncbi:MAG TPA: hypothetical protein PLD88_14060, partial [Candidatus Berkiella sp.]|nr:hypothetical protein [Candidatus Berkiella sp.]
MQSTKSMIPRQVLFADPEKLNVKISPNGKYISYLAPYEEELNLWLAPIDNTQAAKPITQSKQPLKDYCWSANGNFLL